MLPMNFSNTENNLRSQPNFDYNTELKNSSHARSLSTSLPESNLHQNSQSLNILEDLPPATIKRSSLSSSDK
ncbi:unnamed protein product [Dovyalis caffra]|uniref:Uncharacterized protein n=1 Tax=Dovyalis caffra TaxID=77055 RepID=A0AAV1SLR7_9ROSI|nr:unnamed protein product [Dovyalis caffra]